MKYSIRSIFQNDFVRQSSIFTLANLMVIFLGYLFNALSGKVLGPALYSDITTIFSYAYIFLVPATAANVIIVRRIGLESKATRFSKLVLIENWIRSLISSYPLYILLFSLGLIFLARFNNLTYTSSLLLPVLIFALLLSSIYSSLLQSINFFIKLSSYIVIASIIKLLGPLFGIVFPEHALLLIVLLMTLSTLIQYLLEFSSIAKTTSAIKVTSSRLKFSLVSILRRREVYLVLASLLGITLINNLDVIFAKKVLLPEEAGLYGAWSLFSKVIAFSITPLSSVALVFFASKDHQKSKRKILILSLIIALTIGGGLYIFYSLWSIELVNLLIGDEYLPISLYLPLAAIFGTLYGLIIVINNYYLSTGSRSSLIPSAVIPFFMLMLLVFGQTLSSIIYVSILASTVTLALLCLPLLRRYFIR